VRLLTAWTMPQRDAVLCPVVVRLLRLHVREPDVRRRCADGVLRLTTPALRRLVATLGVAGARRSSFCLQDHTHASPADDHMNGGRSGGCRG